MNRYFKQLGGYMVAVEGKGKPTEEQWALLDKELEDIAIEQGYDWRALRTERLKNEPSL